MPLRSLRVLAFAATFAAAVLCQAPSQEERLTPHLTSENPILATGSSAPDFSLPGIDGKTHKLSDYSSRPYLMVMFICNHCPTSQLYEGWIKSPVDYRDRGVAFVAIQPNDPKAVTLSELGYTDVSDSIEEMKIRAEYRHFNFPYLYDDETQSVTQACGAQATPHVFLFDQDCRRLSNRNGMRACRLLW